VCVCVGERLYDLLHTYLLTESQLRDNGYPMMSSVAGTIALGDTQDRRRQALLSNCTYTCHASIVYLFTCSNAAE
jgi:hypothetical protein